MPISFLRRREESPEPEPQPPGPELLQEGPIYAQWYIRHRLEEELRRARRYHRPLSILVARPRVLPGELSSSLSIEVAAEAAQSISRSTDLLGWLSEDSFLIIMPETFGPATEAAVSRWRNFMWVRSRDKGGREWDVVALETGEAETVDEVLEAATRMIQRSRPAQAG